MKCKITSKPRGWDTEVHIIPTLLGYTVSIYPLYNEKAEFVINWPVVKYNIDRVVETTLTFDEQAEVVSYGFYGFKMFIVLEQ